jgi:hypothetical protein
MLQGTKRHGAFMLLAAVCALHGASCGPSTYTQQRMVFESPSEKEAKQSRGGIVVERQKVTQIPAEFSTMAGACNALTGQPAVDPQGRQRKTKTSLVPSAAIVEKISIANNTDHIVGLSGAVIAMFDPADNQYDALDKEQLASLLSQEHACANAGEFVQGLMLVKTIDRNTKILPKRSVAGYLLFTPASRDMTGIWRLSLYEVPVKTDAAGNVSETVKFDFNTEAKRYLDTYRRDSPISPPVLVSSEPAP